ncbi:hypothetical protein [Desulfomonile tiedjei]|uniref:hypothetical protein n=1 Tax=Desulfomonile tiedjei TaxID=2358 RepID=UPI000694DE05|nr:hypothetical protein [Desulfomonile tiedjei]
MNYSLFLASTQNFLLSCVLLLIRSILQRETSTPVVAIMKCGEESVSVAIEEIKPEDWADKVYKPDILNKPEKLYKKPGYDPFK